MNQSEKIMSSLNYFSILFAPFLFPIIAYIIVQQENVKYHAKRAFLSHVIPTVLLVIAAIFGAFYIVFDPTAMRIVIASSIIFIALIVYLCFFIWNLVQGIKLFL